ncbi:MAG: DMP19 family protein [Marinifilaceae bacterium]|jgi:hypothetical protein|nr:DMP19 family protein [Marinifilaceae bacterium]
MLSEISKSVKKLHFFNEVKEKDLSKIEKIKNEEEKFWSLSSLILDNAYPADIDIEDLWKKLTKEQKLVLSMGHLISEVKNGGVWQFLFNKTIYSFAAYESLKESSKRNILYLYYDKVMEQFVPLLKNNVYVEICQIFDDPTKTDEERWAAYNRGEEQLPEAKNFNDQFFKDIEKLYVDVNKYIIQNIAKSLKVTDIKGVKKENAPLKRKEAPAYFSKYLQETLGKEPEECSVYYGVKVTLNKQATDLFLMKFKMPDGYESIGIAGELTYILQSLNMEEINRMHKKHHKQELVNLYYGYHLAQEELKKNPEALKPQPEKWAETLAKLQDPQNSQIPVNVELKETFQYEKDTFFTFSGDLLYNDEIEEKLSDYTHIELRGVNEKSDLRYKGEKNLTMRTQYADKPEFNRMFGGRALSQFAIYKRLVRGKKLVKDNPWGF